MKLIMQSTNSLKQDSTQPRKIFNEEKLQELADSFKIDGIINPIEIDSDNVIVTGERRWRAAKLAGLKEIPCKVVEVPAQQRFLRQVKENLHFDDLTEMEAARALKKLLEDCPPGGHLNDPKKNGIRYLSEQLGKSKSYVQEKLSLLDQPIEFQEAVETDRIQGSMVRAVNQAPEEFKKPLRDKILRGEIKTRDGALAVAHGLRRAPEKADELLSEDYTEGRSYSTAQRVVEIAPLSGPSAAKAVDQTLFYGKDIMLKSLQLIDLFKEEPLTEIPNAKQGKVVSHLMRLQRAIEKYLDKGGFEIIEQ